MRTNKDKFIEKVTNKHSGKYDYSLVEYKNSQTKVKIICPEHGIFEQQPASHSRGQGCPSCKGVKRSTIEEFIKKAIGIHGDIYDYSLVVYKNNKTKVKIICPEHGVFLQRPDNHIQKHGCPICANNVLYTTNEFISKANIVHDNKYNYDNVDYKTAHDKIIITCAEHGDFLQKSYRHLSGDGCSKCSNKHNYNNDEYISKAIEVHGDKYEYNLVDYVNGDTKVKIICPEHGIFEQSAASHIKGIGCFKCYVESRTHSIETFVKLAQSKHGDKYDYSLVDYKNSYTKIKIICPKHGIFEQQPNTHLNGFGCSACSESRGEMEVRLYLERNGIKYNTQHTYKDCKSIRPLPFDFYLPDYNLCVEYDGLQHFKEIEYFGGKDTLMKVKKHDKIKNEYCKNNNIGLLRIRYNDNIEEKLNGHGIIKKK